MSRVLLIQGHPDAGQAHFGHALAEAYARGAQAAGHELRRIEVARLDFPLLRSQAAWQQGELPPGLAQAQQDIGWCQHLLLFFPLWLGEMPALLKGFLEQVARPGFAFHGDGGRGVMRKGLKGRSARLVVTMGMPALLYRWYFRAHGLRSLERNVLGFVGIAPVRETLIGRIEGLSEAQRQDWLERLRRLGQAGR